MEIVGTTGSIQIHDTTPNLQLVVEESVTFPDTTYWPELHGQRAGALRDEWAYFLRCIAEDRTPEIVPPSDSRAAVAACLAAEESAELGEVVTL
jgi:predicted dehydrogenase